MTCRDSRCFTIIAIWIRLLQKEDRIKTSAAMLQIPGFCAIVKAILQELKKLINLAERRTDEPLFHTTILLSRHHWFVPVFIEILIKRINAYKGMDVAFGMTLISKWLQ